MSAGRSLWNITTRLVRREPEDQEGQQDGFGERHPMASDSSDEYDNDDDMARSVNSDGSLVHVGPKFKFSDGPTFQEGEEEEPLIKEGAGQEHEQQAEEKPEKQHEEKLEQKPEQESVQQAEKNSEKKSEKKPEEKPVQKAEQEPEQDQPGADDMELEEPDNSKDDAAVRDILPEYEKIEPKKVRRLALQLRSPQREPAQDPLEDVITKDHDMVGEEPNPHNSEAEQLHEPSADEATRLDEIRAAQEKNVEMIEQAISAMREQRAAPLEQVQPTETPPVPSITIQPSDSASQSQPLDSAQRTVWPTGLTPEKVDTVKLITEGLIWDTNSSLTNFDLYANDFFVAVDFSTLETGVVGALSRNGYFTRWRTVDPRLSPAIIHGLGGIPVSTHSPRPLCVDPQFPRIRGHGGFSPNKIPSTDAIIHPVTEEFFSGTPAWADDQVARHRAAYIEKTGGGQTQATVLARVHFRPATSEGPGKDILVVKTPGVPNRGPDMIMFELEPGVNNILILEPGNRVMVLTEMNSGSYVIDLETRERLPPPMNGAGRPFRASGVYAATGCGKFLALAGAKTTEARNGTLAFFDMRGTAPQLMAEYKLTPDQGPIRGMSFSTPRGPVEENYPVLAVATARVTPDSGAGIVHVWTPCGKVVELHDKERPIEFGSDPLSYSAVMVAISPDGSRVATIDRKNRAKLWAVGHAVERNLEPGNTARWWKRWLEHMPT